MDPQAGEPAEDDSDAPFACQKRPSPQRRTFRFVATALAFELGLGGVAVALGWVLGADPAASLRVSWRSTLPAVLIGIAAAGPLFAALVLIQLRPPRFLRKFNDHFRQQVLPIFLPLSVAEMGLLAAAAGIGEELLFRGLLQAGLADLFGGNWGTAYGLVAASLLFGACHWLNTTYAVITAIVGVYLGVLFLVCDNLLAPIVAHGLYDFAALVYLTRSSNLAKGGA